MFKVSEENYLLQSCDHTPKLFKTMFSDSYVAAKLIVSQKASYIASSVLGPLLREDKFQKVTNGKNAVNMIFNESMTTPNKRYMDIFIRF